MSFSKWRRLTIVIALMLGVSLSISGLVSSLQPNSSNSAGISNLGAKEHGVGVPGAAYAPTSYSAPTKNGIVVTTDAKHDTSPALRDMPIVPVVKDGLKSIANERSGEGRIARPAQPPQTDPVVQTKAGPNTMPPTTINFETMDYQGASPPDTVGEVGNTQFVEMTNAGFQVAFQVWNKSGTSLLGPVGIATVWQGFGGKCETEDATDPIVLYDQLASRWILTHVNLVSEPYYECVAVSSTDDATGSWHRYAFQLEATNFPDYPKLSVWPDAYYQTANIFGANYLGTRVYAFDRANMLTGSAATLQASAGYDSAHFSLLPADLDGTTLPAAGTPNYMIGFNNSNDNFTAFRFHVDWANPGNSTFSAYASIVPAAYTQLCGGGTCVVQPGTANRLDSLADRPMFRAAYRVFGDHEAMVFDHSVVANGAGGIRWYELRNFGTSPSIYQQGTYSPDNNYRWMGSTAMDRDGNLAVGYTVSSSTVYPSIRYAGRLASDPLGQLPQGESSIVTGTHSITSITRWGDYADTTLDPADDCTFWHINEYTTAAGQWATRVGAFKFPSCGQGGPTPTPTQPAATNTPVATDTPVATATNTPAITVTPVLTDTPTPTNTPQVTATATNCANPFVDINGNVFSQAILYLYCRGVVNGVDATHYGPAGTSTRAQFAKVVVLGFAIADYTPAAPDFTDVPTNYFAYAFIEAGFHAGILSGFDANTCGTIGAQFPCYGPNRPITRAQLTKLVVSAGGFAAFTPTSPTFTDVGTNNVFYASIETAHHYGIINGYPDNTFRPNNNIRRDEMAQIVYKAVTTP